MVVAVAPEVGVAAPEAAVAAPEAAVAADPAVAGAWEVTGAVGGAAAADEDAGLVAAWLRGVVETEEDAWPPEVAAG